MSPLPPPPDLSMNTSDRVLIAKERLEAMQRNYGQNASDMQDLAIGQGRMEYALAVMHKQLDEVLGFRPRIEKLERTINGAIIIVVFVLSPTLAAILWRLIVGHS